LLFHKAAAAKAFVIPQLSIYTLKRGHQAAELGVHALACLPASTKRARGGLPTETSGHCAQASSRLKPFDQPGGQLAESRELKPQGHQGGNAETGMEIFN